MGGEVMKAEGKVSDSSSGSSSSPATSDDESSTSSERDTKVMRPPTKVQTPESSLPATQPAMLPATHTGVLPGLARPVRACAKMLVRSNIRCGCHFAYIASCPRTQPKVG